MSGWMAIPRYQSARMWTFLLDCGHTSDGFVMDVTVGLEYDRVLCFHCTIMAPEYHGLAVMRRPIAGRPMS